MFIINFLRIIFNGLYALMRKSIDFSLLKIHMFSWVERAFLCSIILAVAFLLQPWLGFFIQFEENSVHFHKIYSDDFLWFFLGLVFCLLSGLSNLVNNNERYQIRRIVKKARVVVLSLLFILFLVNLIFTSRIALTDEATLTWQFYSFGASLFSALISGTRA